MRVLVISAAFPSIADPLRGVFVKERVKALAELPGFEVRVIAPVPWFPPLRSFPKWYVWSQYPRQERIEGLMTYHPRYPLLPAVGGYVHSELMYPAVRQLAKNIRGEFDFELIDSHFVYPSGVVAARLGEYFGVPVTTTGRGEDMMRLPERPIIGKRIRYALRTATQCIGVSREIANAMIRNGADATRTQVLANGVDGQKFYRIPMAKCRAELGLPEDAKIILSVGEMLELKGFHLLVEALPAVLERHPAARLVLVGRKGRFGRDCTDDIQSRIERLNLQDRVDLVGAVPHENLNKWFNAADLFALMSSREGSPNVLLEALACGLPAVATAVGGIPDELASPILGRLIPERTSATAAEVINQCLGRTWDRDAISQHMERRTWHNVATEFASILKTAEPVVSPA